MRVAVLGGTRFIGVAIVEELVARGHDLLVMHKGRSEASDAPTVTAHVHLDRHDADALRGALNDFRPDALIDTCAYTRQDAEVLASVVRSHLRSVVLSSQDVYRAFATFRDDAAPTDPVPIDEDAPVRGPGQRYLFRGADPAGPTDDPENYENLDVEEVAAGIGATVLRLPMVYGERDRQRREDFILRRVRANRSRIPFGAGTVLWSKAYVRDVARAVRLALEHGDAAGTILNIAEARTWTVAQWAREILTAAGSDAELVHVPDRALPDDLSITGSVPQPMLVDSSRARNLLGWSDTDPLVAVRRSVRWHLDHPPEDDDLDLGADEHALAYAG